jgi:hypothetical protein
LSEKQAAFLAAAMGSALLAGAVVLPTSGLQPYGGDEIHNQIVQEDNTLCAKLGSTNADDPRSAKCMTALAELRRRHERLLAAYSQF